MKIELSCLSESMISFASLLAYRLCRGLQRPEVVSVLDAVCILPLRSRTVVQ